MYNAAPLVVVVVIDVPVGASDVCDVKNDLGLFPFVPSIGTFDVFGKGHEPITGAVVSAELEYKIDK